MYRALQFPQLKISEFGVKSSDPQETQIRKTSRPKDEFKIPLTPRPQALTGLIYQTNVGLLAFKQIDKALT